MNFDDLTQKAICQSGRLRLRIRDGLRYSVRLTHDELNQDPVGIIDCARIMPSVDATAKTFQLYGEAMTRRQIATGVVHKVPADLRDALLSEQKALAAWEDISSIARNEWICWIESAKKPETRIRRIERASTDLMHGKRRPCCWPGCPHR